MNTEKEAIEYMNEEELEAIEKLKHHTEFTKEFPSECFDKEIETVLNYISKLQKENEELKNQKVKVKFARGSNPFDMILIPENFVSKDKIIELKEEWNKAIYWNNADDRYYAVKGLEDLLKEN